MHSGFPGRWSRVPWTSVDFRGENDGFYGKIIGKPIGKPWENGGLMGFDGFIDGTYSGDDCCSLRGSAQLN